MSLLLIPAIGLTTVAVVWSIVLFRWRRVMRLGALAAVLALLLLHQVVELLRDGVMGSASLTDHARVLPDLALSAVALAVVVFIHRHTVRARRNSSALPLREPHWQALVENALDRDIIVILNADAVILYVNPSAQGLLGYTAEEVAGRSVFTLVHPQDESRAKSAFVEGIQSPGPAAPIELRVKHRDDSWRWLEIVGNNMLGDPDLSCVVLSCRDVTERRRQEGDVQGRWAQTQQFLNVAEVMFVALDRDGRITLVNRKGVNLLGYDDETELEGREWFSMCLPPEQVPAVRGVFQDCIDGNVKAAQYYENEIVTKDGRRRLIAWHNVVLRNEAGMPIGTLSAGEDITHRKEMEQELLKFRLGIEKSNEVVFLTDVNGDILYANPAFERVYGFSPEEVLGQTPRILKSGLMPTETYTEFWKALLAKQVVSGELVNKTKHGRIVTVEGTVSPVLGEDGAIIGFLAIQHDVTKRKDTERALRRSEASYRQLIEHATYGIYRSTPDGTFQAVNPALVAMLGYDREEELLALDMARDLYADPNDRQRMVKQYEGQERIEGVEVEWRRKDGEIATIRLSGRSIVDNRGQLQFYEMLAEDVTERRALEQQLRHAQKMEAIGQLTAGIAHDFNNILTTIMANAELALTAVPAADVQLRSDIEEVKDASQRGADMIRKLMAFGRRERLDLESLDLGTVVAETSQTLRRILPENIEVDVAIQEGGGSVEANQGALEQVLLNLASNARDAMPSGGTLSLKVGEFTIDHDYRRTHGFGKPGQYMLLTVSDSGTGMDARTRARVFEPFFTTKPLGRGTGLGLAMVYGLVKQHGGFIDVYSEVGLGTTFRIFFPLSDSTVAIETAADVPDIPRGHETLLVVEDEEGIRRSTQRILERYGYRVLVAPDGQEALDFLRDHRDEVDLVITDVIMPRLGGIQLFEQTREDGHVTPFLFTSGYAAGEVIDRPSLAPDVAFLRKPWTVADLVSKVRENLDRVEG
ncbi:MAG: PAS domain S-box protein [Gemmatimonadota bacterium]|nr:PAS domain S-box protein [Gemmatimonadota bacterium]